MNCVQHNHGMNYLALLLSCKSNFLCLSAKVRRLYDIANILSSLQLIEKVHIHSIQTGRKPGFRWIGIDPDKLELLVANTQGTCMIMLFAELVQLSLSKVALTPVTKLLLAPFKGITIIQMLLGGDCSFIGLLIFIPCYCIDDAQTPPAVKRICAAKSNATMQNDEEEESKLNHPQNGVMLFSFNLY